MASDTIALRQKWRLGAEITKGGFGRIYAAEAEDGSQAVVKLVPKAPGASRELLFEPVSGLPNIIPILDSGEWQDYYVLVMPRAEKSLRQHLIDAGGKLTIDEAVPILLDVAEALASLHQAVVHHDLKPENVLLYQDRWCLADFGIARYAEATMAPDTQKYALTAPYAASEQWRAERATSATDVYAFGVMAFELLQGQRPFPGPGLADFREQHLNQPPPLLTGSPPSLSQPGGRVPVQGAAGAPHAGEHPDASARQSAGPFAGGRDAPGRQPDGCWQARGGGREGVRPEVDRAAAGGALGRCAAVVGADTRDARGARSRGRSCGHHDAGTEPGRAAW